MWNELVLINSFARGISDPSYIVSTENSDDLATTVKLDEEPLVEILSQGVRWYRHLNSESLVCWNIREELEKLSGLRI